MEVRRLRRHSGARSAEPAADTGRGPSKPDVGSGAGGTDAPLAGFGRVPAVLFFIEGELVAYALYKETSEEIYLRHFFVVRHRRREGIGRTAMGKLFADVWPQGKRLIVSVLVENTAALSFWRAMGYRDYALTLEIVPGERPGAQLEPAQ